jgi:hypothetical protein
LACAWESVMMIYVTCCNIQGGIESCTDILTTSYWLHRTKYLKNSVSKNKMTFIL